MKRHINKQTNRPSAIYNRNSVKKKKMNHQGPKYKENVSVTEDRGLLKNVFVCTIVRFILVK
jgi:hypothetical protein